MVHSFSIVCGFSARSAEKPHTIEKECTAQPKLLDQVRAVIRSKHYSRRTEATYIDWITRYVRFHKTRHPRELGSDYRVSHSPDPRSRCSCGHAEPGA